MPLLRRRPRHYLEVHPDSLGEWRWRKRSTFNGQVVATGHQHFHDEFNARRAALAANPELRDDDVSVVRALP